MATTVSSLLLAYLLASTLLLAKVAPLSPSTPSCTEELVVFSPCLSYVSSPPNDLADAASANCCNAFSSAINSGVSVCFCYLLRDPPILGFPLNRTRLLSLSSVCRTPNTNPASSGAPTLNSLCSESPALPPLNTSGTLGFTTPSTTESPAFPPLDKSTTSGLTGPSTTGSGNPASPMGKMPPKSDQRSRANPTPTKGRGGSRNAGKGGGASKNPGRRPFSSETQHISSSRSSPLLLSPILTIFVSLLTTL